MFRSWPILRAKTRYIGVCYCSRANAYTPCRPLHLQRTYSSVAQGENEANFEQSTSENDELRQGYSRTPKNFNTTPPVRRAVFYVPGSQLGQLRRCLSYPLDTVVLDLDNCFNSTERNRARDGIRAFLENTKRHGIRSFQNSNAELSLRISLMSYKTNARSEEIEKDLDVLLGDGGDLISSIVIPKFNRRWGERVIKMIDKILPKEQAQSLHFIPMIATLRDLINLGSTVKILDERVSALIFAGDEICENMQITPAEDLSNLAYARSAFVSACKSVKLGAIDMICHEYENSQKLLFECKNGYMMGFDGKQCIDYRQLYDVQYNFSPSYQEIETALAVQKASNDLKSKLQVFAKRPYSPYARRLDRTKLGQARRILDRVKILEELEFMPTESATIHFKPRDSTDKGVEESDFEEDEYGDEFSEDNFDSFDVLSPQSTKMSKTATDPSIDASDVAKIIGRMADREVRIVKQDADKSKSSGLAIRLPTYTETNIVQDDAELKAEPGEDDDDDEPAYDGGDQSFLRLIDYANKVEELHEAEVRKNKNTLAEETGESEIYNTYHMSRVSFTKKDDERDEEKVR